jgi:hypothetical protein
MERVRERMDVEVVSAAADTVPAATLATVLVVVSAALPTHSTGSLTGLTCSQGTEQQGCVRPGSRSSLVRRTVAHM